MLFSEVSGWGGERGCGGDCGVGWGGVIRRKFIVIGITSE